ncbi:MAG: rubrerythrin family protein [Clostridiales bacterium]|nr:rubrerythrin family protein [Clostridiales bacterium]
MMELKGSKTEKNLLAAFAGESMARTRYNIYASKAKKEGYEQIADVFQMTADNEKEHAERMLHLLEGLGDTKANLKAGVDGEHEEWSKIYQESAEVATQEGFTNIAKFFELLGSVEKEHEKRFQTLLDRIQNDEVFSSSESIYWQCRNCGYIYEGNEAPEFCPLCGHSRGYFERKKENY